ncbi:MAG TPA: GPW/gp25 family protein [Flavobacteriales bacterium]|nr:GPW/gp25 family protein [Flavobacteriales bacterium]
MSADDFIQSSKAFLGRGWGFPPTFSRGGTTVTMLEAEADIKNSLEILLATAVGERVMQPDFGCNLEKLLFEPLDTTFSTYITELIKTAILYNEPRVRPDTIDYFQDVVNGKVDITVNFTIISTNTRSNIVFPYYLNEGTDVQQ